MELEERVRKVETIAIENNVMLKSWIEETRVYRTKREDTDNDSKAKFDLLKSVVDRLPCETHTTRFDNLCKETGWLWKIVGFGGSILMGAVLMHLFSGKGG